MASHFLNVCKLVALLLVSSISLANPVQAGQGKGKGHQRKARVDIIQHNPTPGIPTSPRGRGRNMNPGTPRGRFIRADKRYWKDATHTLKRHQRDERRVLNRHQRLEQRAHDSNKALHEHQRQERQSLKQHQRAERDTLKQQRDMRRRS